LAEGLEISELKFAATLANKDFRIDSDFWIKQPKINSGLKYSPIKDILLESQYGISISMNEEGNGYQIYRMNEIHNMVCDFEVDKYADISITEFKKFELHDRDVLFNRTNSYEWVGRTGLFRQQQNEDFIFASYLVRFVPNQNYVLPEYMTTFLNSKFGVSDIRRRARHSINQTNVNPEEIKAINIPLLNFKIQDAIKVCFDRAIENLFQAKAIYAQAEQLLMESLGLSNFAPSQEKVNIKSFKDSFAKTGRLDAEYYQKKYEEMLLCIKKCPCEKFSDFIGNYSTGYPYKSDDYLNKGIPLIRINNIGKGFLDLSNAAYLPNTHMSMSKKDIAKARDILISMSGTIGNSCIVPEGITALVNQRIMRVSSMNYEPLTLMLILNSIIGTYQMERIGTGGVQTNISSDDIAKILIPVLSKEEQAKIANLIKESFKLKSESEQLLETAKRAVEIAIEQNEEEAIYFINKNTDSKIYGK
jgi:restriction endonuclease S subunit